MKRFGKILFILGIAGLVFLVSARILLFLFAPLSEKDRRINCAKKLKTMGTAFTQYAADNGGNFPNMDGVTGFEQLRESGFRQGTKAYMCPSSKTVIKCKKGIPLSDENLSYIYWGGFSDKDNPDIPLVMEKLGNHQYFVNILFLNGRVAGFWSKFKTYSEVMKMLCKEYKYSPEDLKRLQEKAAKLDEK